MIKDNIATIRGQIASVCRKIGRNPEEITLVGVTKYSDLSKIKEAVLAGLADIGENKIQDAKEKFAQLKFDQNKVTKHMLGHLQTNKVKTALEIFDVIQSVDSFRLGEEIQKHAAKIDKVIDIFIEVNTSGEEQKYGIKKSGALELIRQLSELSQLRVMGLMTMAPYSDDKELVRRCFRELKTLRDQGREKFRGIKNVDLKYLSMGMSGDFEIALEEGSNMVRIGTAIFGA